MRAIVIHETGGPEVMHLEDVDRPEPGEGEVLVMVHAASVNPVDWKVRSGRASGFPLVIGQDFSGVVEVSRADGLAEGDEVFGVSRKGAYAEYTTAPAAAIAKKPEGVSHEQAAALPTAGCTAWGALFDTAELEDGQTALVNGAAGGVGHLAVQFAVVAGAEAIGTGSTANRDFVMGLGADEYVDYTEQDVAEDVSNVDVALDTVGNDSAALVPAVREGGILVSVASKPPEEAGRERGVRAEGHGARFNPEQLAHIAGLAATGQVRVEISETFPLAEAAAAHERSESGHVRGKLVLSTA
jgi:NADPH:quinone reductase-like Zn-dependent oxidoreductase